MSPEAKEPAGDTEAETNVKPEAAAQTAAQEESPQADMEVLAEALKQSAAEQLEQTETAPDPITELELENAELKDRVLRTAADMENLRRRLEREKAEAALYAASNFARDILSVNDNLARALETLDAEQRETADASIKPLIDGIDMTQRELLNVFERHGIKLVNPLDEKFDPNKHEALFEVPDADKPAGTIVQVVQTGFTIGERVLRPARVGVAKAP